MKRRHFLRTAGALAALSLLPIGRHGWAARIPEANGAKRLVVVFLRGAVDGLNVMVPYQEGAYYDARPNIAIPERGEGAVLKLSEQFGMHPALEPLLPFWKEKRLAFVHACGSPDATRSHFDAQDYMESGTPGKKSTADGWMNRVLAELPGTRTPASAVSFGPTLPRILDGKLPVANVAVGKQAERPMVLDNERVSSAFDKMYNADDALSRNYRDGKAARAQLLAAYQKDMMTADNNAPSALGFASIGEQAGRLMARDPNVRLVFLAVGGWDTHVNQGAASGQLANHLRPLGEGLAGLARTLGSQLNETAIVVLSEFGRTVKENGNRGTDHGHGNVMWILGGNTRGGRVYGEWPGLSDSLYEGRDLPITTDFRDVLAHVCTAHLGLKGDAISRVFPAHRASRDITVFG